MKLWLIRYPDGQFQGSPLHPSVKTDNPHLAATWKYVEIKEAKHFAMILGGVAVPYLFEGSEAMEAVSKERALQIYEARGPMGEWPKGSYTETENLYIRKVWDKLPGEYGWVHALLTIVAGNDA